MELGRILKTEHILYWMADPHQRKRTRKGLLKVEQIHQLARDITYGNRGRLKGKSVEEFTSSGNCTIIMIACIIYWQAKEISRIVKEYNPEEAGIDISLLAHISWGSSRKVYHLITTSGVFSSMGVSITNHLYFQISMKKSATS